MELQVFDPRAVAKQSDEMEFQDLCSFGDRGGGLLVFRRRAIALGNDPECDELLHVIDGEIEVEVLPSAVSHKYTALVPRLLL